VLGGRGGLYRTGNVGALNPTLVGFHAAMQHSTGGGKREKKPKGKRGGGAALNKKTRALMVDAGCTLGLRSVGF